MALADSAGMHAASEGDEARTEPAPGVAGSGREMHGENRAYLDTGLTPDYGDFTWEAWAQLGVTMGDDVVVGMLTGGAPQGIVEMGFYDMDGDFGPDGHLACVCPSAGARFEVRDGSVGPGGPWHYVVVTRNGTQARLFQDGELASEAVVDAQRLQAATRLLIGRQWRLGGTGTERDFEGLLDEVRTSTAGRSESWVYVQYISIAGESLGRPLLSFAQDDQPTEFRFGDIPDP